MTAYAPQKKIPVKSLEEGFITAKQVVSDHGILLEKGTCITIQHINLLKKWKVKNIWIENPDAPPAAAQDTGRVKKKNILKLAVKSVDETYTDNSVKRPVILSPEELKKFTFEEPDITAPLIHLVHDEDDLALAPPDNVSPEQWSSQVYNSCTSNTENILLSARADNLNESSVIGIIKKLYSNLCHCPGETIALSLSDTPENYLVAHSLNCTILSMAMGMELNMEKIEIETLGAGALLHDVGMTKVEDLIWTLGRKLNETEKFFIWKHTLYGADILSKTRHFKGVATSMAYQHHEKLDSSGYPKGKNGSNIHKFSKILACADVFCALTCPRPYRPAYDDKNMLKIMKSLKGKELTPEFVDLVIDIAKTNRLIDPNPKSRVLIVEDDKLTLKMLSHFLEHSQIEVHTAENGIFGLKKTADLAPDLILLDIMMPELDGYGFMEQIQSKEEFKNIPVIVVTSKATIDDVRKMMSYGINSFIRKPCDQQNLRKQVLPVLELQEEILEFI
jgi:response regulator RpfG family c-di-GMP phosphodiesterase